MPTMKLQPMQNREREVLRMNEAPPVRRSTALAEKDPLGRRLVEVEALLVLPVEQPFFVPAREDAVEGRPPARHPLGTVMKNIQLRLLFIHLRSIEVQLPRRSVTNTVATPRQGAR